jgi:hypothetical protein
MVQKMAEKCTGEFVHNSTKSPGGLATGASFWDGLESERLLGGDGAVDFLETGGLATQTAKVEEFGAANLGRSNLFDLVNDLCVEGEDTLDALAEADLAHSEAALGTLLEGDDDTLEGLDAFLVAFFNLDLDANGVAGHEIRMVRAIQFLGESLHYWMNRHSSFLTMNSIEQSILVECGITTRDGLRAMKTLITIARHWTALLLLL